MKPVEATAFASSLFFSPNLLATIVETPTPLPKAIDKPIMTKGVTTPIANKPSCEYRDI